MDRGLFSKLGVRGTQYIAGATILLMLILGIALVQSSLFKITALPNLDPAVQLDQPAIIPEADGNPSLGNGSLREIQPPDLYSAELEKLAQQGRTAFSAERLPASPNAYTAYLDNLRRLGQASHAKQAFLSSGPNQYIIWLDELRRMGAEAYVSSRDE